MLPGIFNKLHNGFMVYHFSTTFFKEISFCTQVLNLLWKENFIRGYIKTNDGLIKVLLRYYDGLPMCNRLIVISRPRDRLYMSSLDLYRMPKEFEVVVLS
ncbi:unnamed protein product, partial [Ascophyllum nodosum]